MEEHSDANTVCILSLSLQPIIEGEKWLINLWYVQYDESGTSLLCSMALSDLICSIFS